jgi:hypothetical protein
MSVQLPRRAALLFACATLAGCLVNSVQSVPRSHAARPAADRAIVVIGVGLEVPSPYRAFAFSLDQYSLKEQKITGNCFHYNRINLQRPADVAAVRYFAFDVPAGTYVYSGFDANVGALRHPALGNGFIAPGGHAVYFGDYVLVADAVEVRRDFAAARASITLPRNMSLELATPIDTPPPGTFLCAP